MNDIRLALRTLTKSPGLTLAAIFSLALGTGANTAIFSLVDAVMLRMLPIAHPEELVFLNTNAVKMGSVQVSENIRAGSIDYLAKHATTISGIAGDAGTESGRKIGVGVNGQVDRATGQFVSGDYYSVLGVSPVLGRTLTTADATPDGRAAVISFAYWQSRFGGSPSVVGRAITINNVPFTIVGVTPREFYGVSIDHPADITAPLATLPQVRTGTLSSEPLKPEESAGTVFARLKHDVTYAQAAAELTPLVRQSLLQIGGENRSRFQAISHLTIDLKPAAQGSGFLRSRFSEPLKVLMAVVAVVLLIACANVANLLLAKSSSRSREIAIRMSLGSSRSRLIRQLLTESMLLAGAGGAIGFLFAIWARDAIIAAAGVQVASLTWDYRVLAFTAGVCLLSAIVFGVAPAFRATALDIQSALKSGGARGATGRFTIGRVLVAIQVALSLALVMGAGLFLYTFHNLDAIDLGYARTDALMITLDPGLAGYHGPRIKQLYAQVLDRLARLPGVRSATLMTDRLMSGSLSLSSVSVPGYVAKNGEDAKHLWVINSGVGSHFLSTSGIQLVSGRDFDDRDTEHSRKVAMVNETMAQHFWGTKDATGRQFTEGPGEPVIEIVGVVRDIKYWAVRQDKQDVMFTPAPQSSEPASHVTILLRTAIAPPQVVPSIRDAIRAIDAAVPVYDVLTVDQQVQKSLSIQLLLAMLSAFFGALALALAAIGLYGVLSYVVSQRTGEIGIRMALGAQPGTVLRMILRETAFLVMAGLAVGTVLALGGAHLVRSLLFGVTPTDPLTLASAAAILLSVGVIASLLPARRAARVDPMVALRHE